MITFVNLIARLTRQWVFLAMCTLSVTLCFEFEQVGRRTMRAVSYEEHRVEKCRMGNCT